MSGPISTCVTDINDLMTSCDVNIRFRFKPICHYVLCAYVVSNAQRATQHANDIDVESQLPQLICLSVVIAGFFVTA